MNVINYLYPISNAGLASLLVQEELSARGPFY